MYALSTIRRINAEACAKPRLTEGETTRHCSYCKSDKGVVLHSALQRSTAFIEGATARNFLVSWFATNSATKRDRLVESFFNSAPRGKQHIVSSAAGK